MKSNNMTQLFDKLNDLKLVFNYGQKVIPIIQNLIDFMHETIPLIETINESILESANKMPNAYYQINDVTHATEVATSEILDLVDTIANEIALLEKTLTEEKNSVEQKEILINEIKEALKGNNEAEAKFEELISISSMATDYSSILNPIAKIKSDAYSITLSLQVQDITSQQLSAVNHLIQSVQLRLSALIEDIEEADFKEALPGVKLEKIKANKGVSFDENASYISNTGSQELADSLVNNKTKTTQDEIDKLFS